MPKGTSAKFREIFNYDDYKYVVKSEVDELPDENFPNLPCRAGDLGHSTIISFEYKGSDYRLLSNIGDPDCNDGTFGALFDGNNDKVVDLISFGDTKTKIESLKNDDVKMDDDLQTKLSRYLRFFGVMLANKMEFEYLVFKVLVESKCLGDINDIDDPSVYGSGSEDSKDYEEEDEEEENEEEKEVV